MSSDNFLMKVIKLPSLIHFRDSMLNMTMLKEIKFKRVTHLLFEIVPNNELANFIDIKYNMNLQIKCKRIKYYVLVNIVIYNLIMILLFKSECITLTSIIILNTCNNK